MLAPDWPGSRAAERRGTTRAPCTRTPQRIAHCPLRCPKRNKAKRATRKGRICPARSALLSVGRVQGATFSLSCSLLLSLLSLFAGACFSGAVLSLSVAWSVRVYAARAQTLAQHSTAHTPSRMRPRASRCGNMAYALFSSTGPAGLSGIVLLCTPARLAHAPFLCAAAAAVSVLLFPFLAIADGPGDGAGVCGRGRGVLFRYGGWASCALVCALPTCLHFSCFGQCPPPLLALLPAPLWAMAPPRAAGASVHNSAMAPLTPARPRWAVSPTATIRRGWESARLHDMRIRHGAGWPYDALCWCLCGTSQRRMPDDLVLLQLCNCPAVFAPFVVVHASLLLLLIARFSHGSLFPFPFPFLFSSLPFSSTAPLRIPAVVCAGPPRTIVLRLRSALFLVLLVLISQTAMRCAAFSLARSHIRLRLRHG